MVMPGWYLSPNIDCSVRSVLPREVRKLETKVTVRSSQACATRPFYFPKTAPARFVSGSQAPRSTKLL